MLLGVILAFGFLWPSWASELDQHKKELEKVNRLIQQQKEQIAENKQKQRSVLWELEKLEQDIDKTDQDLQKLNTDLVVLQAAIRMARKELQKAEADLDARTEILYQRLRDIYIEGHVSYLEVLLQSASVGEFLTRFDMLQRLAAQDIKLMKELAVQRDRIVERKKDLENKRERVAFLQERAEVKKSYLAARTKERKRVLDNLQSQREAYERALDELEATSRYLTQIIQQLQAKRSSSRQGTGRFIWPAPGYGMITSAYGMRFHPILRQYRMHTGIDIGAPMGTSVIASDGGTVIYTGWMGGYGEVVVIDHGGNYSTLYAHLSSILVRSGDQVRQGQTVGRVGSTGWSTGPHLHFEVRVNGEPQDPTNYL